jgi:hypothetical protein
MIFEQLLWRPSVVVRLPVGIWSSIDWKLSTIGKLDGAEFRQRFLINLSLYEDLPEFHLL